MKSKFCISSTASFDKINKAPTNNSITKQTFSFARSNRFEPSKPTCPQNTYGGDLPKKSSGTAIGYGQKSDFTKCLTASPSASKYNLKSFWDENLNKKKGSSFGLSRDKVSFNNYIPSEQLAFPSSVHYKNDKPNKLTSPRYTMRHKTTIIDKTKTIEPQNRNPGPGSYLNPEIQSSSSFRHASKFQNISYGQSKTVRFGPSDTITPGPGKYSDINNLSKNGQYLLSKNKGGTGAKFERDRKESMFDRVFKKELANPGPGYYQLPSEFGQYDGNIYNQLRQSKRSANGWKIYSDRTNKI